MSPHGDLAERLPALSVKSTGLTAGNSLHPPRRVDAIDTSHRLLSRLEVVLAGLEDRDSVSGADLDAVRRDLAGLLKLERQQSEVIEKDKADRIIRYMVRSSMEECLNLWFGKSEKTDREIAEMFGPDVELAAAGHLDHWALDRDDPRMLVALVILLDQFPRNIYRDTTQAYASDLKCQSLVKRGLRLESTKKLRPVERVFLCLVLTHSESLADQHRCMEEWGITMETLDKQDPLNVFHEIFHRHVAVIQRFGRFPHRNKIFNRKSTAEELEFLDNASFRFDLPLIRRDDGTFAFAGTVKPRTVKLLDHEYQTMLPDTDEVPEGSFEFRYEGPGKVFTHTIQQLSRQGYIRIGDKVPDFEAETSQGPIKFHDWVGNSWCVLFSHPADFRPVCTTEVVACAKLDVEWRKRNVKVLGLSVDGTSEHSRWIDDIHQSEGAMVNFPIIADKERKVAMLFGMLDATHFKHGANLGQTMTTRSVFVISPAPELRVELIVIHPARVGRNFEELIRVIDALQLATKHRVATPANWVPGADTVVLPYVSDEDAALLFGDTGGFRKVTSYLRYVRDPSLRLLST